MTGEEIPLLTCGVIFRVSVLIDTRPVSALKINLRLPVTLIPIARANCPLATKFFGVDTDHTVACDPLRCRICVATPAQFTCTCTYCPVGPFKT